MHRKDKLPNQQNGQVYLTSHRVCYVDKADPRKYSVALDLKDVERYEFYVSSFFLTYGMDASTHNLFIIGWLPQVLGQGHLDSKANKARFLPAQVARYPHGLTEERHGHSCPAI